MFTLIHLEAVISVVNGGVWIHTDPVLFRPLPFSLFSYQPVARGFPFWPCLLSSSIWSTYSETAPLTSDLLFKSYFYLSRSTKNCLISPCLWWLKTILPRKHPSSTTMMTLIKGDFWPLFSPLGKCVALIGKTGLVVTSTGALETPRPSSLPRFPLTSRAGQLA